MHDIVTHLFLKVSVIFPSSYYPIPSHNRLLLSAFGALFPAHSLLTLSLPGFHCQPCSPGPLLTSMLLEPVGSSPTLCDLVLCSTQIGWTLPPGMYSLASMPSYSRFSTILFGHSAQFPLQAPLPPPTPALFTICPDFSLLIHEYILILKDTSNTKIPPHSFKNCGKYT